MINNEIISNKTDIADSFNNFFTSIGEKLANNIPPQEESPLKYLESLNCPYSFYLLPTNHNEVLKTMKDMKNGSSEDNDLLNANFIKYIMNEIADPLTHIINSSFETGVFPEKMKIARVIPLHKNGDTSKLENYRPISILPIISKITEKIFGSRLKKYFEKNNLFSSMQFGFRSGYSTELAIQYFKDYISNNIDKGLYSCGVFLDLSKAFDTVDHQILIKKLEKYGIRSNALSWLGSYLSNRYQLVDVNGYKSKLSEITSGVPQGSVLGPILFLIYINDIGSSTPLVNCLLFADDTTIFQADKSLDNLLNVMNNECSKLTKWLAVNRLTLNAQKTKYIIFSSDYKLKQINNTDYGHLEINNYPIDKCNSIKFLGVYLQSNLKWCKHTNNISSKLAKSAAIMHKLKWFLPSNVLLSIYNTLFLPHINYCIGAWGNTERNNLNHIIMLQKRVIRSIGNASYLAHTDQLFKKFSILKCEELFQINIYKFMYKLMNNLLPCQIKNYFNIQQGRHTYNTRQVNNLAVTKYKTELYSKSIRILGPKLWNTLPNEIKSSPSLNSFKKKVMKFMKDRT